ncbi:hypothetical protein AYK26_00315 [Euryarchaeota archaeon SM23-78]|nr:MAG: hypothetical protein AYK26_00315 [Euryarchaeota archaeon SM23-78]MBW3000887.1 hypothetical protein [Candidatus Woesearchaeota archaeon]
MAKKQDKNYQMIRAYRIPVSHTSFSSQERRHIIGFYKQCSQEEVIKLAKEFYSTIERKLNEVGVYGGIEQLFVTDIKERLIDLIPPTKKIEVECIPGLSEWEFKFSLVHKNYYSDTTTFENHVIKDEKTNKLFDRVFYEYYKQIPVSNHHIRRPESIDPGSSNPRALLNYLESLRLKKKHYGSFRRH